MEKSVSHLIIILLNCYYYNLFTAKWLWLISFDDLSTLFCALVCEQNVQSFCGRLKDAWQRTELWTWTMFIWICVHDEKDLILYCCFHNLMYFCKHSDLLKFLLKIKTWHTSWNASHVYGIYLTCPSGKQDIDDAPLMPSFTKLH